MDAITDFFSYLFSPILTFLSEVFAQFQAATTYVLNFLMAFLQGIMNVIQAILQLLNIGNY